jgi:molybdenum transport protein
MPTLNAQTLQALLAKAVKATGGVRADSAAADMAAGADFLVTSAPYTAGPRDVQVNFARCHEPTT